MIERIKNMTDEEKLSTLKTVLSVVAASSACYAFYLLGRSRGVLTVELLLRDETGEIIKIGKTNQIQF